ncbi:MAG: hypothetical protein ACO29Q_04720 [Crocinitomicaceae bacterium]
MNRTFELEVELDNRNVIVQVECEYGIENDGIGPYEYWGSKEVDRGSDYVEIYNTDWDRSNFNEIEIAVIESAIKSVCKQWEIEIANSMDESMMLDSEEEDNYY